MFQRTKKTAGRLYDYTKKITNIDEAKKNAQDLRVIVQDHANPFKKHQARQETFQAAMQRLGIQMQDLGSTYKYYSNRFYLFTFFSLLTFCCAAWALFQTNWVMFGPSVSIFLVFSIHALSASFRARKFVTKNSIPSWSFSNTLKNGCRLTMPQTRIYPLKSPLIRVLLKNQNEGADEFKFTQIHH